MSETNRLDYGEEIKKLKNTADNAQNLAGNAQSHSELNRSLIITVLVVLSTGFIGLLVTFTGSLQNALAERHASYMDLRDNVYDQNKLIIELSSKVDLLIIDQRENK